MEHISRLSTQKTSVSSPLSLRGSTSFQKGGFRTSRSAFTLVELMIVIAIIGVLAASLFPMMSGYMEKSRDTARTTDLRNLNTAISSYYHDTGSYPVGVGYTLGGGNSIASTGSVWKTGSFRDQIGPMMGGKMPTDPLSTLAYYYGNVTSDPTGSGYTLSATYERSGATVGGGGGGGGGGGSWTVAGGGDCSAVDNALGANGNTATCLDNRTYTHVGAGATHDRMYSLIKIAGKWWMNENIAYPLDSSKYRGSGVWSATDDGLYSCPGDYGTTNSRCDLISTLGYIYQWSAASSVGLCPNGWLLPSKTDFSTIGSAYWPDAANDNTYLGNTIGWNRNDSSGGRFPDSTGQFGSFNYQYLWSSNQIDRWQAWSISASKGQTTSSRSGMSLGYAFSVRCLKN